MNEVQRKEKAADLCILIYIQLNVKTLKITDHKKLVIMNYFTTILGGTYYMK